MSRLSLLTLFLLLLTQVFASDENTPDKEVVTKLAEEEAQKNFVQAFIASISVILVSEIGDKTFFIAAIMAAQFNRLLVFCGAMTALAVMTALSAAFGSVATLFLRVEITQLISNILFVLFGLRSLREGIQMSENEDTELKETVAELKEVDENEEKNKRVGLDAESGLVAAPTLPLYKRCLRAFFSRIYLQALTMTFLAEWGDRSQITTVILATHDDPYGVTLGGCIGHFICTGCAVIGGRLIAQKISVKTITIIGGVTFLLFAIHGFYVLFSELNTPLIKH